MSLEAQLEELLVPLLKTDLGVSAPEGPEQLNQVQELLAATDDPTAGFAWLSERIATLPPTAGSWVGVYLGGLVERGRLDAAISAPGALAFFRTAVLDLLADPDHVEWAACAGLLGPTVMTQLAADAVTLNQVRDDAELLDHVRTLAASNQICAYVQVLARQETQTLVLLDPQGKRGMIVDYANLATLGHLITMVQSVLPSTWSEGRAQEPQTLAVGWGENPGDETTPDDEAWFLYTAATREPGAAIDPDAGVRSLPMIDGRRVLTVFPTVIGELSWHASSFTPQPSPPSLTLVRDLELSEVITLTAQI